MNVTIEHFGPISITLSSVFQPGCRGTQRFRQLFPGFREKAINSTIWTVQDPQIRNQMVINISGVPQLEKG